MVSTDDDEIAAIARHYGAMVPFLRSADNANDFAATIDVLKEVEQNYRQILNKTFDFICCIYPTAPLMNKIQLQEGFELLKGKQLDAVFPIVPFSYPVWRGLEILDEKTKMVWPQYINSRSQDLKTVYHDAGQWYWYNPNKIRLSLFTENTASLILSHETVQDIDTLIDWKLAEMKYQLINGS